MTIKKPIKRFKMTLWTGRIFKWTLDSLRRPLGDSRRLLEVSESPRLTLTILRTLRRLRIIVRRLKWIIFRLRGRKMILRRP